MSTIKVKSNDRSADRFVPKGCALGHSGRAITGKIRDYTSAREYDDGGASQGKLASDRSLSLFFAPANRRGFATPFASGWWPVSDNNPL